MTDNAHSNEATLAYLERYHELSQHWIGIAKLTMSDEQRARMSALDDDLSRLFINRLLALGVPFDKLSMFNGYTPEEIARLGIKMPSKPVDDSRINP